MAVPSPLPSTCRFGNAFTNVTPPATATGGRGGALHVMFEGRVFVSPSGAPSTGGAPESLGSTGRAGSSSALPQLTIQAATTHAPSARQDEMRTEEASR